jgi:hypothetical protein
MPKNLIPRAISMILRFTNQTLTTAYFPKLWKLALVIFIPKTSPSNCFIKDYRLISLVSCLTKEAEAGSFVNHKNLWMVWVSCLISNLVFELSTPQFTR